MLARGVFAHVSGEEHMAKNTYISWTDSTHNFWYGCVKVSQGCKNCYAEREMDRFGKNFHTVTRAKGFDAPLKWREPRKVFVNSWSDFFIEGADAWRDEAFAIMARTPHLIYQILTKRAERMHACMQGWRGEILPNVWIGVSAEDQEAADARIPLLLDSPAALRFVSYEPALEAVDFRPYLGGIDWVICGGESGPDARPCSIQWLRAVKNQCRDALD